MKSDMIDESDEELLKNGFNLKSNFAYNIEVGKLSIKTKERAKALDKDIGEYVIINSPKVHLLGEECKNYTKNVLIKNLKNFIKPNGKIFVVGLGNPALTADSLGDKVIKRIYATGALSGLKKGLTEVCTLVPDVYSKTGIKTQELIEAVVNKIKPSLVVVIDSLGTYNEMRLASSFQISTSGITAGGALYEGNKPISKQTLGVNCVVLGVPLMLVSSKPKSPLTDVLCPKNIDEHVITCADIIAQALNEIFHRKNKVVHNIYE